MRKEIDNMEKNYGKIFKDIRTGKNLTLKDVATDGLSLSFLSKFERGQTDIALTRFFHLLSNLNVTIEEFSYLINDEETKEIEHLMSGVSDAYYNNNTVRLKKIAEEQIDFWKKTQKRKYQLYAILVNAYICHLTNQKLDKKLIEILSNYLFGIEDWGKMELMIYGNTLFALPLKTILLFSNELIGKISLYGNVHENYKATISILFNTIYTCLDHNSFSDARRYIEVVKNMKLGETMLFEKIELKFLIGIYNIKINNIEIGKNECEEVLKVLKVLNSNNLLLQRETYFKEIMKTIR